MESTSSLRRGLAAAALVLAGVSLVIAVVATVQHFPRGLIVLACAMAAIAVAWHGILRRGVERAVWLALAGALLIVGLLLLVARDPLQTVLIVVLAAAALACARAAAPSRAHLPTAQAPERPVLIFNPHSGGGKAVRFDLPGEARRRGIEPVEMVRGTDLTETVSRLLADGADAIAVAGGDGTQALAAAVAAREGVPYACIPAGTRNHFALDLGVDRDDVVGALDAFVDGGERVVDLAEVNGRVFVNNVSLGLYADAVTHAGYRDAKLRTILDTVPEVIGPDAHPAPLRWRDTDGLTHEGGAVLLVSNNVYRLGRMIGAGTRPSLSAHRLGVTVIDPQKARGREALRTWSQTELEVQSTGPVPAGIDGETVELRAPLRFTIRPGALRVRIARQHPGCSPSARMPDGGWDGVRMLARLAVYGTDVQRTTNESSSAGRRAGGGGAGND
ncbi:MAG: diacylglycerol kinase family protein [Solirubrobacteraceae bacterium]